MKLEPMLWVVYLLHVTALTGAARILALLPFPGKSHHMFSTTITKALAQRGHHVVEYSPYPPFTTTPNYTHVPLHTRFENVTVFRTYDDLIKLPAKYDVLFGVKVKRIWQLTREVCEDTFNDKRVQQLLRSDSKFDLVITSSTFGQESLLAFGHRFSAATVTLETLVPWAVVNWVSGNTLSSASVPDLFAPLSHHQPMTLAERAVNTVSILTTLVTYHYWHLPFHQQLVSQHLPTDGTPSVYDMVHNVSLYLTNSHPSVVNYIQPYTPNVVPVGGLHINPKNTKLPKEIQTFLDNSKDGFIYFSLGTVIRAQSFPKDVRQTFMNVFKKLSQNVLWKIDLDELEGIPSNVKIAKWVPQLGVLEHPNCQLFITHGGLFSHHETIYAGVPTVGIPFFADQPYNLQYNILSGLGVRLDFANLTEETLYSAISTVLNNSRYKEAAARMSRIYRDRPLAPLDSAVFWIEYVLRHGGTSLQPASTKLSWYQLALLDILAAVLLVVMLVLTVVKCLLRLSLSVKRPQQTKKSKKNN